MRAWLNLRHEKGDRAEAFRAGLVALGYEVRHGLTHAPGSGDVLVTWNRIGSGETAARRFEAAGLQVLVAENAAWGNDFARRRWVSLARGRHNTAGCFPVGGLERWDSLGVNLAPWRRAGEVVLLPQRGIGSPPTAMPRDWAAVTEARLRREGMAVRTRHHPGRNAARPLEDDLAKCGRIFTWGSGAAIKALMMGIPVESDMPHWIGAQDNTDAGRLAMFRRLAWAQWTLEEVAAGDPFRWLLSSPV